MPPDIPGQPHKTTSPPLRDLRGVPHLGDGLASCLAGLAFAPSLDLESAQVEVHFGQ